jgi:hypothetical protein
MKEDEEYEPQRPSCRGNKPDGEYTALAFVAIIVVVILLYFFL